jgi:site-specific DNA recombinase
MTLDTTTRSGRKQITRTPATYAGYVRVSRQGSREDERFRSPSFQAELIEQYGAREGLAIELAPAEIDVSGSKAKRPVLDELIRRVEVGELAGIIVAKLDRLSRLAPRDRVELFERIESAGGVILSASESLDASTPEGRFARAVFLEVARMQWEKYRDNFEHAKVNAIELGIPIASLPPYGYRRAEQRLEVVEAEAAVVRELFELRAAGASYGVVLAHFERESGRSSYRQTVHGMLGNRTYLGELHYGRAAELVNEEAHPAIVELELFEEVQRMNAERGRGNARHGGKAKSLLAGIVKCAGCGRGLVETATGRARTRSYKCPNDARHCASRASINSSELNAFVIERVLEWAGPSADELVELEAELDVRGDRVVGEHRLAEAERLLLEWSIDLERQERSPDAYQAGLAAREERVALRRRELEALGEASELEVARSTVRQALAGDELEVAERRRLLGAVLGAVIVRKTPRRGAPAAERVELRFGSSSAPAAVAQDRAELVDEPAA